MNNAPSLDPLLSTPPRAPIEATPSSSQLGGDFFNNQLDQELGNVAPPPPSYQDFLKQNNGIAPVTFGDKDGMASALESQYFDAEHNWKKETGANNGRGGGGGFDPQAAYQSAVVNNKAYNPNMAYIATQWLREQMAKDPATAAQMADQKAQEEFAASRKYTPAMQEVRSRLSPEGQAQFDSGRDGEILQKLFPDTSALNPGKDMTDINAAEAARNANYGKMSQYEIDNAAAKDQAIRVIEYRLQNGLIGQEGRDAAIQTLNSLRYGSAGNGTQYTTTNSVEGKAIARLAGLPDRTAVSGRYGERNLGNEPYKIANELDTADASSRAQVEKAATAARAASGEARAVSDQMIQEQEFRDKKGQRKEADIVELTAPDGTKINVLRQPSGSASEVSKAKKEEAADGIYQMPGGGVAQIFNGNTTIYNPGEAVMGVDGILYLRGEYNGDSYLSKRPASMPTIEEAADFIKTTAKLTPQDEQRLAWVKANPFDPRAIEYLNILKAKRYDK